MDSHIGGLCDKAEKTAVLLPERFLIVVNPDLVNFLSKCLFRNFRQVAEAIIKLISTSLIV